MAKVSEAHRAERRRCILSAAITCFARRGLQAATMQEISREAGLSAGTIYLYFKSKDDLVEALARAGEAQTEAWSTAISGEGLDPLLSLLRSMGEVRDPTASQLSVRLWAEAVGDERLRNLYLRSKANWLDCFRNLLGAVDLQNAVRTAALAQVLVAALAGLELQRALEPEANLKPALEALAALLSAANGRGPSGPDAPVFVD